MSKINFEQLMDTIHLLQKYSKEDWSDLFNFFQDKENFDQLIQLSKAGMNIRSKNMKDGSKLNHGKSYNKNSATKVLRDLQYNDREKYLLLSEFRDSVTGRKILGSTEQLRNFSESCGFKDIDSKTRRETITNQLISYLSTLEVSEIEKKLSNVPSGSDKYGSEYENWVRVILGRKYKMRNESDSDE